jgi:hypothetical protein
MQAYDCPGSVFRRHAPLQSCSQLYVPSSLRETMPRNSRDLPDFISGFSPLPSIGSNPQGCPQYFLIGIRPKIGCKSGQQQIQIAETKPLAHGLNLDPSTNRALSPELRFCDRQWSVLTSKSRNPDGRNALDRDRGPVRPVRSRGQFPPPFRHDSP